MDRLWNNFSNSWKEKTFQKIQKIWFRHKERSFPIGKNGSSESYILEKEIFLFQEKIENNANNSQELWKALKSMGMKSGKLSRSKIVLKNDGGIQFEPTKNANIFKAFLLWFSWKTMEKVASPLNNLTITRRSSITWM